MNWQILNPFSTRRLLLRAAQKSLRDVREENRLLLEVVARKAREIDSLTEAGKAINDELTAARAEIATFKDTLAVVTEKVRQVVASKKVNRAGQLCHDFQRTPIGGKTISRAQAVAGLPSDAECEATRAEFKLKPIPPHIVQPDGSKRLGAK